MNKEETFKCTECGEPLLLVYQVGTWRKVWRCSDCCKVYNDNDVEVKTYIRTRPNKKLYNSASF